MSSWAEDHWDGISPEDEDDETEETEMTDPKQPLYDILGDAFKAGQQYEIRIEASMTDVPSAASILFPLAARMEEEVKKYRQDIVMALQKNGIRGLFVDAAIFAELHQDTALGQRCMAGALVIDDIVDPRSLPSSSERET